MKKYIVAILMVPLISIKLYSQDATISEQDLKLFAAMEDSVSRLKSEKAHYFNQLVVEDSLMNFGKRFLEIKSSNLLSSELIELDVEPLELAAYNALMLKYEEIKKQIKAVKTSLIQEELGVELYNRIKRQLRINPSFKAKYEHVIDEIRDQTI
ncbi:hypothetical protein [Aureibacter tunicatorum]|uniref:DUF4168 domain-containing protein n=1 Tax=Aureibacter tunicatorum TaxID=866807 RepID=A0AAE4BQR0_9BACT|nr:hypothetical protein [Aureibacter tunicatorum]MDR6239424.1 hypothetical protein [Aureibacter tunicatorum]